MSSYGQNDYSFEFQNQTIEIPENINRIQLNTSEITSHHGENLFVWMQFFEIPTQERQDALKSSGVDLINYISNRTYLAKFSKKLSKSVLVQNGVRGMTPLLKHYIIEGGLLNGNINSWAIEGKNVKLILTALDDVPMEEVITMLQSNKIQILRQFNGHPVLEISLPIDEIETLAEFSFVKWVEEITAPSIKEDIRGKSIHRSNGLDTQTSAGRDYTGKNIGVLVRDDGIVGPHIDFEGRIDNSSTNDPTGTHGDGVAGILTGAGNLDPNMRGMAAGSNLYVSNYESNFLDAPTTSRIADGSVQITNSSYGNGCNAGYTTTSSNVDEQIFNNPTLLHVFSCGNSGNSNCGYGAGSGWGNITGGHKQGKNVIATANLFFNGFLVGSSSRGPAYDGRIKPDIAAHGQEQMSTDENNTYLSFGGTSGASPGIAGVSAQLYQAYSEVNHGSLPPSALIKATLLNTANDAGNDGPDFMFGWGIVNGLRAGKLIEDGRHLKSSIAQGGANSHKINVPTGTKQVRFMLYWMDPAALNGVSTALINDLDLVVTDPGSGTHLPWILDPTPNAAILNTPATNGADHLNNMEQVLINSPAEGEYTIDVSGFAIPMGPQEYYVVYEFISNEIEVTYPNNGEHFVPGEVESIHWDAPVDGGTFDLEYSPDNGATWNSILTISPTLRTYAWTVPNDITGSALLRVTRDGVSDVSDFTFSIAPLVTGQDVSQICPTSRTFSWNPVADAESYDVYVLGTKYMEVVGNSNTTNFTHTITNPNTPFWYAVVAKNETLGWESRRTIASYYPGGLLNCNSPIDASVVNIENQAEDFAVKCSSEDVFPSIAILNNGSTPLFNFNVSFQLSGQAVVNELYTDTIAPGMQAIYTFETATSAPSSGYYTLTCSHSAPGDGNSMNDAQSLSFYVQASSNSVPFIESFEDANFLANGWVLSNPDNAETWEETSIAGSAPNQTKAAFVNNYIYNAKGEEDAFETDMYTIPTGTIHLTFDVAKAQYNSSLSDSLAVQISSDCGKTWTTIYAKGGSALATVPNTTANWSPMRIEDWRTEDIEISAYVGQDVMFKFININGYSNGTYLDNINLVSTNLDDIQFIIYPNPTNGSAKLVFTDLMGMDTKIVITNYLGQIVQLIESLEFTNKEAVIDLTKYRSGIYFLTVYAQGLKTTKRIVKK